MGHTEAEIGTEGAIGAASEPRARADSEVEPRLAIGFEELRARLDEATPEKERFELTPDGTHFDVVIVGSGYGGAIAADALAGCTVGTTGQEVSVCVLERGLEYQPRDFPSEMAQLPSRVRFEGPGAQPPKGELEGLFDARIGEDVCALVANGLGGGSLINAGVMLDPVRAVLDDQASWPADLLADVDWDVLFEDTRRKLGAEVRGIARSSARQPRSMDLLERLSPPGSNAFARTPLSIAMQAGSAGGADAPLEPCIHCGDCMTGCRHGAKISLDVKLLASAARHEKTTLVTGVTVLKVEKLEKCKSGKPRWRLHLAHTDRKLRERAGAAPTVVDACRVILAAGAYGSTEILLRSASDELRFSKGRLGARFSTNGDMIAAAWGLSDPADPVAHEAHAPDARKVGPTISGMLDFRRDKGAREGILLQTLVIPSALRRLYEETVTTSAVLNSLDSPDRSLHEPAAGGRDPCAVDPAAIEQSIAFAMMGDDGAGGRLELFDPTEEKGPGTAAADGSSDGRIVVKWPELRNHPLFERQLACVEALLREAGETNARVLPNPLWRPMTGRSERFLAGRRGPLLTVHPLGGCPMGDDRTRGVVDHLGQVFDGEGEDNRRVHDGLYVLDGSIVPRALGVNPALTIAALALRAIEKHRSAWEWTKPRSGSGEHADAGAPPRRGIAPDPSTATQARPTLVELRERLSGELWLRNGDGHPRRYVVELTIATEPVALAQLHGPMQRELTIRPEQSMLRIYAPEQWRAIERPRRGGDLPGAEQGLRPLSGPDSGHESRLDAAALLTVKIHGRIRLLHREASCPIGRAWRTLPAWVINRGARDIWQSGGEAASGFFRAPLRGLRAFADSIRFVIGVATRAGEVRRIDYELRTSVAKKNAHAAPDIQLDAALFNDARVHGFKRLTYERRGNPWKQLMRLAVDEFPTLAGGAVTQDPRPQGLELDARYLARGHTPLLRIVGQQDQVAALADLASFAAYWTRLLARIHLWSFRAPDASEPSIASRLPGRLMGIPGPVRYSIRTGGDADPDVRVMLSRYPRPESSANPVILVHGYSASGNTFAHPAVKPNLASWLWERGRDVWIVDLRTSSAFKESARRPWRFEDAALVDLPRAIEHVRRKTGWGKVDVVAHCMGAAMFSMAVLKPPPEPGAGIEPDMPECDDELRRIRKALPEWIGHTVLSEVGPVVSFSPANIFRAYAMRWVRRLLPLGDYQFRDDEGAGEPSRWGPLLDRLLATLPYPDEEFDIENPVLPWRRASFVRTRHRMDALYGRDFSLANIDAEVLRHIDELFGPLSTETVAQTIHFARHRLITDRSGRGVYLSPRNLRERWTFPTLYLHAEDNGLTDPATAALVARRLGEVTGVTTHVMPGLGHQDSLIGRSAFRVFQKISDWLDQPDQPNQGVGDTAKQATLEEALSVRLPSAGPILVPVGSHPGRLLVRLGVDRALGAPEAIALVEVGRVDARPAEDIAAQREASVVFPIVCTEEGGDWISFPLPREVQPDRRRLALVVYPQPPFQGDTHDRDGIELAGGPEPAGNARPADREQGRGTGDKGTEDSEWTAQLAEFVKRQLSHTTEDALSAAELTAPTRPPGATPPGARETTSAAPDDPCLLVASCQYPAGMLDADVAEASYRRMGALLDSDERPRPEALLLLGDQIYADATAGLFDPVRFDERHADPYRALMSSAAARAVLRRLPVLAMPDDHEIADNWEPASPDHAELGAGGSRELSEALDSARSAFAKIFGDGERGATPSRPLWFSTTLQGHPLFMLDTRTRRGHRDPARIQEARITDQGPKGNCLDTPQCPCQACALERWLGEHQEHDGPVFIASPSMLLPRRRRAVGNGHPANALRSDAWDGYPGSLDRLLLYIANKRLRRLVFLSGDEHLPCVARISLEPKLGESQGEHATSENDPAPVIVHSIHSSPLYSPWPFSNASPDDFRGTERFDLPTAPPVRDGAASRCECRVDTEFFPMSASFARVSAARGNGNSWELRCDFFQGGGQGPPEHSIVHRLG